MFRAKENEKVSDCIFFVESIYQWYSIVNSLFYEQNNTP